MTSQRDLEYDFFGQVAVADTLEAYERAVVPFLSSLFSAQSVLAISFNRTAVPEIHFRWIPDHELRATFDRAYSELGYMLDPFFQRSWQTQDWEACLLREIAPDRFESSEYFSAYFSATNMVDDMGLIARISEDKAVHLSVGRSSGQRRYRSGDITRFRQIARVLAPKLRAILAPEMSGPVRVMPSLDERFFEFARADGKNISRREAEVAALIVRGYSSRAISLKLGISMHTVKVHRRALYKKLTITSQSELFGILTRSAQIDSAISD